jgi:hypothetical protein
LDNNVGQNKSQVVFMFFALLSMTLYPDGVALLFLVAGHSHMAPDRTVSWLRKSLSNRNTFVPEQFIAAFNTVRSVEAEFINHLDNGRLIYERWDEMLKAHLAPIPAIKDGGYTKYHFFEFHNGVLNMRHSTESNIEHTHVYVQRASTQGTEVAYATIVEQCVKSFEKHLFYPGITFANATPLDINIMSNSGLMRHGRKEMQESQLKSFWTKGFSIPTEYLSYFPPLPTTPLIAEEEEQLEPNLAPPKKKSRKSQQSHATKIVQKNIVKPTSATSVSKNSLARYFTPALIVNNSPNSIGSTKVSKEPMIWHNQITPVKEANLLDGNYEEVDYEWAEEEENHRDACADLDGGEGTALVRESSTLVGQASPLRGENSVLVGEGSPLVGEATPLVGEHSEVVGEATPLDGEHSDLVGEASSLCGEHSAVVGKSSPLYEDALIGDDWVHAQPPIPKGHVVYQRTGNKVVTGPAPTRYDGLNKPTVEPLMASSPTASASTNVLLPRPGIGFCNFCGSSTRHCKLIYSGCNMSSCPAKHVMYSFPWRRNSCAIDSLGSCLQMSYNNLTKDGKEMMEQYCPDLCQLFANLSNGIIPSHKAKEALEKLLGDRLWTNQTAFWKFRAHSYEDVDVAFKLYQIRPPSSWPATEDQKILIFTSSITVADACKTKDCSAHGVGNFTQEDMDYLSLPIRSTYNTDLSVPVSQHRFSCTQSWTLPTVSKNEEERDRIILRTSNISNTCICS